MVASIIVLVVLFIIFVVSFVMNKKTPSNAKIEKGDCSSCQNPFCKIRGEE